MLRNLSHLLIVFALLFGQHAAQQHALYHAGLPLAGTGQSDGKAPLPDHGSDRCLAFQGVGSALTCTVPVLALQGVEPLAPVPVALPHARPPRIEFDSRAPPYLFS